MTPFELAEPTTLKEAIGLLDPDDAAVRPVAGGTALMLMMKAGVFRPRRLVSLCNVAQLTSIDAVNGELKIGAMTPLAVAERSATVRNHAPVITKALRTLSNIRVRNVATIGGSLAHADPAADWPAAAIALGVELVAEGPKGKRTIKADDFFKGLLTTALAEDEILTEIRVPAAGTNVKSAYAKFPHPASRFAVVGVAAVLTVDGGKISKASIGITGAGTKATRAKGVEGAIAGKAADAPSIQAAAEKAAEGVDVQADLQGSVEYKQHLLRVFAKRAMEAAAAKK